MNEWVRLAVGLAVLLGAACAVSWRAGLGAKVARAQATAAARAVVQLAVVALALRGVFAAPLAAVAVIVVMFSVATSTSARRLAGLERAGRAVVAGCALGAGLTITVVVALPTLDRDVRTLVAVSGIVIGNSMTASTLAGRHLREGLHRRRDEIEAWLSLGATSRQACSDVARSAAAEALVPGMDQTRTVGLVTLPGAFIGALLGGANAIAAARFQLVVLVGLLCAQTPDCGCGHLPARCARLSARARPPLNRAVSGRPHPPRVSLWYKAKLCLHKVACSRRASSYTLECQDPVMSLRGP